MSNLILADYPDTMSQSEKRAAFAARQTGFNKFTCYPIKATLISTSEPLNISHMYKTCDGVTVVGEGKSGLTSQWNLNEIEVSPSEAQDFEELKILRLK